MLRHQNLKKYFRKNNNSKLVDCFLKQSDMISLNHSNKKTSPSFLSPQGFNLIDDAIVSKQLSKKCKWDVLSKIETWSDHCITKLSIIAKIPIEKLPKYKGFKQRWTIPTNKLTREYFKGLAVDAFGSDIRLGNHLLRKSNPNKEEINRFYGKWIKSLNYVIKKTIGYRTKEKLNSITKKTIVNKEINDLLTKLATNRTEGLSLLDKQSSKKWFAKWKEERQKTLKTMNESILANKMDELNKTLEELSKLEGNPKLFWKKLNKVTGNRVKSNTNVLREINGSLTRNKSEFENRLFEYYRNLCHLDLNDKDFDNDLAKKTSSFISKLNIIKHVLPTKIGYLTTTKF